MVEETVRLVEAALQLPVVGFQDADLVALPPDLLGQSIDLGLRAAALGSDLADLPNEAFPLLLERGPLPLGDGEGPLMPGDVSDDLLLRGLRGHELVLHLLQPGPLRGQSDAGQLIRLPLEPDRLILDGEERLVALAEVVGVAGGRRRAHGADPGAQFQSRELGAVGEQAEVGRLLGAGRGSCLLGASRVGGALSVLADAAEIRGEHRLGPIGPVGEGLVQYDPHLLCDVFVGALPEIDLALEHVLADLLGPARLPVDSIPFLGGMSLHFLQFGLLELAEDPVVLGFAAHSQHGLDPHREQLDNDEEKSDGQMAEEPDRTAKTRAY